MSFRSRLFDGWGTRAVSSVAVAFAGVLGWTLLFTQGFERLSYDLPFTLRFGIHPEDALVVYMDDDSRERLKQPVNEAWDRHLHIKLLNELFAQNARAVVFDVLLDEPWPEKEVDEQFAAAIRTNGRVVLGASCHYSEQDGQAIIGKLRRPVESLASAAPWGVAEFPAEMDGTIRRHFYDEQYTNLAWQTASLLGLAPNNREEPRWLNFYGPSGSLPQVSFYKVLEPGQLPVGTISNKVVFVGKAGIITSEGSNSTDEFPTPYTRWTGANSPGVEIQATAFLNLLRRDWLSRLPFAVELTLILMAGFALGFLLPILRPGTAFAFGAGSSLGVAVIGIILANGFHCWFSWAVIAFVEAPASLVVVALHVLNQRASAGEVLPKIIVPEKPSEAIPSMPAASLAEDHAQAVVSPQTEAPPQIPDHQMLRKFGGGSYGQVWIAKNALGAFRAVKVVFRSSFESEAPFEREFSGIKSFEPISRSHEGFVDILQIGRRDDAGYFYYVMELADDASEPAEPPRSDEVLESRSDGEHASEQSSTPFPLHHSNTPPLHHSIMPSSYSPKTLASQIKRREKIPCEECVQIGLQLTAALQKLHESGLVHRDIKPSNIIFVAGVPKLADIGLVAITTEAKSYVGTEGFMPPEGPGSIQADIYSLGKVLYEMAMGRHSRHYPELPTNFSDNPDPDRLRGLNDIILKACHPSLKRRYSSAQKMHDALKKLANKIKSAKKPMHRD